MDRYGGLMLGAFAVLGIAVVALLVLSNASGKVYACDSLLTPGPSAPIPTFTPSPSPSPSPSPTPSATPTPSITPSPSPSPTPSASPTPSPSPSPTAAGSAGTSPSATAEPSITPVPTPIPQPTQLVGFPVEDLGRTHILDTSIHLEWDYCPPASGHHFNVTNAGPIKRDFYGPTAEQNPGGWVHDLEHGYVVIAYSCAPLAGPTPVATPTPQQGCPSAAEMAAIQDAFNTAPQSATAKTCGDANKLLVLRFDSMTSRFAYIAWDRVELTNTFDEKAAITFMQQWQDQANPEQSVCV